MVFQVNLQELSNLWSVIDKDLWFMHFDGRYYQLQSFQLNYQWFLERR